MTKPGTYKLAPVRFTYFDTKSGGYKTVASEPVTVTIGVGEDNDKLVIAAVNRREVAREVPPWISLRRD